MLQNVVFLAMLFLCWSGPALISEGQKSMAWGASLLWGLITVAVTNGDGDHTRRSERDLWHKIHQRDRDLWFESLSEKEVLKLPPLLI